MMQCCCLMYNCCMPEAGLRERSKARRRAAIIRAAYELFAERGYHATTIADIAEAAEVSPRTVAMYFPAKQDIALSRFSDGVASLTGAIRDRRPGETDHDAFGRWLLTSQAEPEERELYRLARRMFAANPDLGALRTARMAAAVREGAAMIGGRSRRDRDGDRRHRTGRRTRAGRRRRDALPRGRDRSALITGRPPGPPLKDAELADMCATDQQLHPRIVKRVFGREAILANPAAETAHPA